MKKITLSPFVFMWAQIRPISGILTIKDLAAMRRVLPCVDRDTADGFGYAHFRNAERARFWIDLLRSKGPKLSKMYEVRLFTDYQFGRRAANGAVKFTEKQNKEVVTI